ncbi:unnamed protein product [Malus baccata var. baccata]
MEGVNELEFEVRWKIPEFRTLKVNCDAVWNPQSHKGGVGWVIKDFAGLLHSAGGLGDLYFHSAEMAEGTALKGAL